MRDVARSGLVLLCGIVTVSGGVAGCASTRKTSASIDAAYVSGFCKAGLASQADANSVKPSGQPTPEDFKKLGPVVAKWADALQRLSPPTDVRSFHDTLVKEARVTAANLTAGTGPRDPFLALEQMTLPPKIGARLQAVAAKDPDCVKANIHFDQAPAG